MITDSQDSGTKMIAAAIDLAEEISDPLSWLVDATKNDPGAPFEPEAISALTELRRNDLPAYEKLRAQLKGAGCRVTELDAALHGAGSKPGPRETQADVLVEHASSAELFHSTDEVAFADIEVNGHRETWRIRSTPFRRWLLRQYYDATRVRPATRPSSQPSTSWRQGHTTMDPSVRCS